ncbi:hypothetical protein HMPREF3156_01382 [Neisseria sp. HMSC06F02]|nr:hypothetical protein HMPREF3156_01382 [Neisseria sp. HMSC06F02]
MSKIWGPVQTLFKGFQTTFLLCGGLLNLIRSNRGRLKIRQQILTGA